MNKIVKEILNSRGLISDEDISEFLSPKPTKTYDPFLLHNMKEGVDIIMDTVKNDESICIYGDYDADGITSICIMKTILEQLTDKVSYYIPSRFEEGYGLNKEAIAKIKEQGADLMLTVDCGSVSCDEVEYAKEIGLKVVVTDHHTIDGTQADCVMINPKKPECKYPFKGLAGCGVAYKMAQALQRTAGLPKQVITRLLDIAAVGTIGDIVPLQDENRTIVKYGLRELNSGNRLSLKMFAEGISLHPGSIGSDEVAFGIVPHLNAAGRMDRADIGVKLLLSDDRNEIMLLTEVLKGYNNKRKEVQQETYEMCLELLKEQCPDSLFPVIKAEKAHEGITGIVAGKIKDREGKPVIITTPSGDMLKGTGRSTDTVDIYGLLKNHEELFVRFGGHKAACGFLMEEKNLEKLRKGLDEDMKLMDGSLRTSGPAAEMSIHGSDVTLDLAEELETLSPFGNANPRPLFRFENMTPDKVSLMGNSGIHMRFEALSGQGNINCVLFGRAQDYIHALESGKKVDVFGELSINEWNGNRKTQVLVRELT